MVKYIMEEHGGSVEAVNDGGLKLILRFPRADKKYVRSECRDVQNTDRRR